MLFCIDVSDSNVYKNLQCLLKELCKSLLYISVAKAHMDKIIESFVT